jgi:hypothetical protein
VTSQAVDTVHEMLSMTLGTGLHSVEDGDDKTTSGVAKVAAREESSDLALRDAPWANARNGGIFPLSGFFHHVEEFIPFKHLYIHTHRRWGSITAAVQPRIEAAGGRWRTGFEGADYGCTSTGTIPCGSELSPDPRYRTCRVAAERLCLDFVSVMLVTALVYNPRGVSRLVQLLRYLPLHYRTRHRMSR